jgi:hypothetical protein
MAGFGKVISLNDEVVTQPRIRRDQYRKISTLVRTNGEFPLIALGLVRDFAKNIEDVRSIQLDSDENPTYVSLKLVNAYSKMHTEYQFNLIAPILLESPTL